MIPEKLPSALEIGLEAETCRRVLTEHLARGNVAPQNATRTVPRSPSNGALGRSVQRSLRCHPSTNAVAGDVSCVHACPHCCRLEDRCDRITMQALSGYVAVTIDSAKDCTFGHVGCLEPLAKRSDRAGIIVLVKRDRDFFADLLLIGFRARQSEAGDSSKPAAWWAFDIEARRRAMVAGRADRRRMRRCTERWSEERMAGVRVRERRTRIRRYGKSNVLSPG
jgi:hypothetical protein